MDVNPIPVLNNPIAPPQSSKKKYFIFVILIILLIISMSFNVFGFLEIRKARSIIAEQTSNPLFTNLSANIEGKIINISGKTLAIQDKNGIRGEVLLSDNAIINKYDTKAGFTQTTQDLKQIELNNDVNIFVSLISGKMQAVTLNFLSPLNPAEAPKLPAPGESTVSARPPAETPASPSANPIKP